MKLDFIVLGAAKSGTSWVHSCLEEHPDVFVPLEKELHFFSYQENYQKGIDWYESFFTKRSGEKAIGEVCPSYLADPTVAQKIYDYNSNVKLLAILRNPIDRAYSHYCMNLRGGSLSKDIDLVMTPENNLVHQGLYHHHLEKFRQLFDSKQIKVLIYDDLKKNPEQFIKEIYDFIGVDSSFVPSILHKRQNQKKALPKFAALYNILKSLEKWINENSTYGKGLINYMRRYGYFDVLHKINKGTGYPQLSAPAKAKLVQFYQPDISAESQLLNRDLSFWLQSTKTSN